MGINDARTRMGGFFKARREEMGMTLDQVGDAVGVTANTIKGIESGRFQWEIDLHIKLCNLLKIKLPYEL